MAGRKPSPTPPATVAERQAKARARRERKLTALIAALREIRYEATNIARAREIAAQALALVDWH